MPIVRHAIMWTSQVWRDIYPQMIQNNWRMSKTLPTNWCVNFVMDDGREKSRIKESTNQLASLISSSYLGSEEMPIKEYV